MKSVLLIILGTAVVALPLFSQAPGAASPSFEVASVKPNSGGSPNSAMGLRPDGRFIATNVPLNFLMRQAYRIQDFQIIGAPNWFATERFDIEAKAEPGTVPPPGARPDPTKPGTTDLMIQSLLTDRFQLKFHRDTRDLPIYTLSVAKDGPKFKSVEPPPLPGQRGEGQRGVSPNGPPAPGSIGVMRGNIRAAAIPIPLFISILSQQLGRPIVDKTDLKGYYDIQLQFALEGPAAPALAEAGPPPASDPAGPSIFTAVQEQLGLKLESTKSRIEVLVVDSVQKPSEN